jgi:hypothetical protein
MSPGEWSVDQSPGLILYYWRKIKVSEQEFRWPHQNHLTRVPRKFNDKTLGSWITNSILFVEKWGNVILQNSCRTYSRCSLLLCTTLHTYSRDDRNSYFANVKIFLLSWTNLFSWSYLFSWFWYKFLCKFLMISSQSQDLAKISDLANISAVLDSHAGQQRTRYCTTCTCHMQVTPLHTPHEPHRGSCFIIIDTEICIESCK